MDLKPFIQRLQYMRAECADMLLDKDYIQGDINNYNLLFERRKTINEILEELSRFQSENRDEAALGMRFTGTTIV